MSFPWERPRHGTVIEDPETLGYRLVDDPLLAVMSAAEWRELERAALHAADRTA
ncbi:MAG TPA: hypothetical protein VFT50_01645 [Baekduia sp.]|nr:hypothetical protein [Baekduia sp.]